MRDYIVIPLGELIYKEYSIGKIESAFKRFSCQREIDLENFLVQKAMTYERTDNGKTYLCVDKQCLTNGEFMILAYFTITLRAIDISVLSPKKRRKVLGDYPGRDNLTSAPAFLIGQLGRCDLCSSSELSGQQLLNECYHAISLAARVIGGRLLVLECREHMFKKFYEQQGFKKLYDDLNNNKLYTLYKKINFSEYWNT